MPTLLPLDDSILAIILGQLPLRKAIQLRRVCRKWKWVVETRLCHPMTSLKVFGSLKAVIDYYQLVNCDYHQTDGPAVAISSLENSLIEVNGPGACNRVGCACRRPMKFEMVKNFTVQLPGGIEYFPNFSIESGDDHLVIPTMSSNIMKLLMRLFPQVEHVVIFHTRLTSKNYFSLLFRGRNLKHLEMYDRNSRLIGPKFALNYEMLEAQSNISRRPRAFEPGILMTMSYQMHFRELLTQLEELTLDGDFVGKYFLWDQVIAATAIPNAGTPTGIALKRLKLYHFTRNQLMSERVRKAVAAGKSLVVKQLTHLTLGSVSFESLNFICNNFTQLEYLDVDVDYELKSYDLVVAIHSLSRLTELRLRSNEPSFFSSPELHAFFTPELLPPVRTLHLYMSQLTLAKLELITKKLFTRIELLVLDIGLLSCNCEAKFASEMFNKQPYAHLTKYAMSIACDTCVASLPRHIPPGVKLHFFDGCCVVDTFYQLNQRFYSTFHRRLMDKHSLLPMVASGELRSPPTVPRRLGLFQRIRRGLQALRPSTRRLRATRTPFWPNHRRPGAFQYFDLPDHEDALLDNYSAALRMDTDQLRRLLQARHFAPFAHDDDDEDHDQDDQSDEEMVRRRPWGDDSDTIDSDDDESRDQDHRALRHEDLLSSSSDDDDDDLLRNLFRRDDARQELGPNYVIGAQRIN